MIAATLRTRVIVVSTPFHGGDVGVVGSVLGQSDSEAVVPNERGVHEAGVPVGFVVGDPCRGE